MGRKKVLFEKNASEPFKLSRSKLELFMNCPRCFYLDRKLGISGPPQFPFNLNNAVDALMKKEFDIYRKDKKSHPLMKNAGLDAVPLQNELLDGWQDYHSGLKYHIKEMNIVVYGAPDDVWVTPKGEYIVVDYKATSSDKEVNLDDEWKSSYKHQVEIYQWLLKKNGYKVNKTAYFVYTNALKTPDKFNDQLTFKTKLLSYDGNTSWVEGIIKDAYDCLCNEKIPEANEKCKLCEYVNKIKEL
jgi:CRISPR/Cas system-associated exonuclease Cas4 (RecB family)